jgi:hypothetical protein
MYQKKKFKMDLGDFELLPEIKEVVVEEKTIVLKKLESRFQDLADIVGVRKNKGYS